MRAKAAIDSGKRVVALRFECEPNGDGIVRVVERHRDEDVPQPKPMHRRHQVAERRAPSGVAERGLCSDAGQVRQYLLCDQLGVFRVGVGGRARQANAKVVGIHHGGQSPHVVGVCLHPKAGSERRRVTLPLIEIEEVEAHIVCEGVAVLQEEVPREPIVQTRRAGLDPPSKREQAWKAREHQPVVLTELVHRSGLPATLHGDRLAGVVAVGPLGVQHIVELGHEILDGQGADRRFLQNAAAVHYQRGIVVVALPPILIIVGARRLKLHDRNPARIGMVGGVRGGARRVGAIVVIVLIAGRIPDPRDVFTDGGLVDVTRDVVADGVDLLDDLLLKRLEPFVEPLLGQTVDVDVLIHRVDLLQDRQPLQEERGSAAQRVGGAREAENVHGALTLPLGANEGDLDDVADFLVGVERKLRGVGAFERLEYLRPAVGKRDDVALEDGPARSAERPVQLHEHPEAHALGEEGPLQDRQPTREPRHVAVVVPFCNGPRGQLLGRQLRRAVRAHEDPGAAVVGGLGNEVRVQVEHIAAVLVHGGDVELRPQLPSGRVLLHLPVVKPEDVQHLVVERVLDGLALVGLVDVVALPAASARNQGRLQVERPLERFEPACLQLWGDHLLVERLEELFDPRIHGQAAPRRREEGGVVPRQAADQRGEHAVPRVAQEEHERLRRLLLKIVVPFPRRHHRHAENVLPRRRVARHLLLPPLLARRVVLVAPLLFLFLREWLPLRVIGRVLPPLLRLVPAAAFSVFLPPLLFPFLRARLFPPLQVQLNPLPPLFLRELRVLSLVLPPLLRLVLSAAFSVFLPRCLLCLRGHAEPVLPLFLLIFGPRLVQGLRIRDLPLPLPLERFLSHFQILLCALGWGEAGPPLPLVFCATGALARPRCLVAPRFAEFPHTVRSDGPRRHLHRLDHRLEARQDDLPFRSGARRAAAALRVVVRRLVGPGGGAQALVEDGRPRGRDLPPRALGGADPAANRLQRFGSLLPDRAGRHRRLPSFRSGLRLLRLGVCLRRSTPGGGGRPGATRPLLEGRGVLPACRRVRPPVTVVGGFTRSLARPPPPGATASAANADRQARTVRGRGRRRPSESAIATRPGGRGGTGVAVVERGRRRRRRFIGGAPPGRSRSRGGRRRAAVIGARAPVGGDWGLLRRRAEDGRLRAGH